MFLTWHRPQLHKREPSRLEQNTNQRLTGHRHSPTQARQTHSGPVHSAGRNHLALRGRGRTSAVTLAAAEEKRPRAGRTGKLKCGNHFHVGVCGVFVCVCHLFLRVSWSRYTGSGWRPTGCTTGAASKPAWDWSATAVPVSDLRSARRVQNTNTDCPHNTGLLAGRREER